jgi:hypothetical protein
LQPAIEASSQMETPDVATSSDVCTGLPMNVFIYLILLLVVDEQYGCMLY